MEKTVSAVLVAAGSSTRMGFDKLSFDLGGETVLHRSIRAFAQCPQITELVLVAGKNREFVAQQAADCPKPVQIVAGGATRAESAKNGVLAAHGELVAVHDAARPFVSASVITAALEAAARCGAAAPAVPVKDTIKTAARGDGKTVPPDCAVCATPDRSTLYAVQTPQCFDRAAYLAALEELDETRARLVTDDCSLFELTGRPVQLTQGDYANLKITTREDLPCPAQRKETEMRIGHGYDVHRLVEQRKLILGGVEIPFEKGLLGHSDADVLTHAVMDAVLGAAALGDIGQHFPDNDPEYAGADSLKLACRVAQILKEHGWRIENIDATLLCQRPKLAPHIPAMRANLAAAFGLPVEAVSVKATTEEHLGFTGEGLGIAAHAVALISCVRGHTRMTLNAIIANFQTFKIVDLLDIIIIAFLIYQLLGIINRTRAGQLAKGALLVMVVYLVANTLNMRTVTWLLNSLLQVGLLTLVVLFQPEIRRALERMGQTDQWASKLFNVKGRYNDPSLKGAWRSAIIAICDAAERFSETKTGALIVLERHTNLSEIVRTGTPVNSAVNLEVLGTIFYEGTPLHDGAAIIENGRIKAAGCVLPLSNNLDLGKDMGTRHRACLGIAENSDAIAIVVSEETGIISMAKNGVLIRHFDRQSLYTRLIDEMIPKESTVEKNTADSWVEQAKKLWNWISQKGEDEQQ
ncbi:MAG: diadenylate cyclase CdaA [Faecalibacterium prausnitzii]